MDPFGNFENDVLRDWYALYPERFQNKTNGITQRRWLGLCNPELSNFITDKIGSGWLKDLSELSKLESIIDDDMIICFNSIKDEKKKQLSNYIQRYDNIYVDPNFIFDIQVKRMHEYKRQLLNAFSIMDIYFKLKSGELKNWNPTAFILVQRRLRVMQGQKQLLNILTRLRNLLTMIKKLMISLRLFLFQTLMCLMAKNLSGSGYF